MIALRQVAIRRGGRELLADVDITLHAGWRVGVVGRNGCGKSSLFAAMLGELEPDRGHVERPRAQRIAAVAQETPALPDPALEFVLGGDAEAAAALPRSPAPRPSMTPRPPPAPTSASTRSVPTTRAPAPVGSCTASASRPTPTRARLLTSPVAGARA